MVPFEIMKYLFLDPFKFLLYTPPCFYVLIIINQFLYDLVLSNTLVLFKLDKYIYHNK